MTAKKQGVMLGLGVAAVMVGMGIGSLLQTNKARAADNTGITTAQVINTVAAPTVQPDQTKGGHVGANGVREEVLTGDTAAKVTEAALKAVPGGTILRVETDAEGAVYEAHMTQADGSPITVYFDADYNVTGTQAGMGGRGVRPAAVQSN